MFKLTSDSDEGFSNRSKDIFAGIDNLAAKKKEKDNKKEDSSDSVIVSSTENKQKATQDFKGQESIFRSPNELGWPPPKSNKYRRRGSDDEKGHGGRRPNHFSRPPPPRRRGQKTPDHIVNPNKYTKYSLSDVSKDMMSDRSNTRAAFDFLRGLKDRKDQTYGDDPGKRELETSLPQKVTFKKPGKTHQEQQQPTTSGSVVRDGVKRVMPECVVGGRKRPKENDKLTTDVKMKNKKAKKDLVSLSHLDDDGDEDENDF